MHQSRAATFVLVLSVLCVFVVGVIMMRRRTVRRVPLQVAKRPAPGAGAKRDWDPAEVSPVFFGYNSKSGGVRAATTAPPAPASSAAPPAPASSAAPPAPTPAAAAPPASSAAPPASSAAPPAPSPPAPAPSKPDAPQGPPPGSMMARADPVLPSMYKLLPPVTEPDPLPSLKRIPLQPPMSKTLNPMPAAHRFSFNSIMRNVVEWPYPWRYRLPLPAALRNVVNVTLYKGGFPLSEYVINEYNKYIDVSVGGVTYTAVMEERNVDVTNFATVINAALAQLLVYGITITATATIGVNGTGKLTFSSSTGPFTFLFRTGPHVNRDPWQIFGFERVDTPSSTVGPPYVLAAPERYDITGTFAIMLFCDELTRFIETEDGALAHINTTRYVPGTEILFYAPSDVGAPTDRQIFATPIGRLLYLTFNFVVPYAFMEPDGTIIPRYRPYLFNGRNHSMQILFGCREYLNPSMLFTELESQT